MMGTQAREIARESTTVAREETVGDAPARQRIAVRGVVQGVGFRPFVYGLAMRLGLTGTVSNVGGGVSIDVHGAADKLGDFRRRIGAEAPPLARIESIAAEELSPQSPPPAVFEIVASTGDGGRSLVSPDVALCEACRRELRDPADRRYRYPFINCTDCGPRFTIVTGTPYDRPLTTMADFAMCPACRAEYEDPTSRRFHAQPIACPECGPRLEWRTLTSRAGEASRASEGRGEGHADSGAKGLGLEPPDSQGGPALAAALDAIADGRIIAVKGIGGFHIACDATRDAPVAELRRRKGRAHKPLAVMVKDLEMARRYAVMEPAEVELLSSRERPIVLLESRPDTDLSPAVAPGQRTIGLMLPYTPLHELLLSDRPLVMTSGNLSGEPIVKDDAEAHEKLGAIVDGLLGHDRPIHTACDDSVYRLTAGRPDPIRRSRGDAPGPLTLPVAAPPLVAVGGELKSVFCLAEQRTAFLSQHLGDVENPETLAAFERAYHLLRDLFAIAPEQVVCDLHPGYLSSQWAQQYAASEGLPLHRVQHHHAHVAALMAEHGLDGSRPVLGFSFDGTGYGSDGTVWGGEALVVDRRGFERVAHLRALPLPGGDAAVRQPARLALAYLHDAGLPWRQSLPPVRFLRRRFGDGGLGVLRHQLDRRLGTVGSSSMGRLFDAVAALLGGPQEISYEGQAAIELEVLAARSSSPRSYRFQIEAGHVEAGHVDSARIESAAPVQLDPRPMLAVMLEDLHRGVPAADIAAGFHSALAHAVCDVAALMTDSVAAPDLTVGLTGGVFQNVRLLTETLELLGKAGRDVLWHEKVPANDGGLALGQAFVAATQSESHR